MDVMRLIFCQELLVTCTVIDFIFLRVENDHLCFKDWMNFNRFDFLLPMILKNCNRINILTVKMESSVYLIH